MEVVGDAKAEVEVVGEEEAQSKRSCRLTPVKMKGKMVENEYTMKMPMQSRVVSEIAVLCFCYLPCIMHIICHITNDVTQKAIKIFK